MCLYPPSLLLTTPIWKPQCNPYCRVGGYVVAYKMVSEEIQYNKAAKEKGAGKAVDARPWHKVPWKVGFALHAVAWYVASTDISSQIKVTCCLLNVCYLHALKYADAHFTTSI